MELMTTAEAARYLRLTPRKVYDLVAQGELPHVRVTGKLLFAKRIVDLWLEKHAVASHELAEAPPIVAGSSDPLLEWALRESDCGLAVLFAGSRSGLDRLAGRAAAAAGLHILDTDSGEYNAPALRAYGGLFDVVLIEWAWRQQGLIIGRGNPLGLVSLADAAAKRARLVRRQPGAGAQILLDDLLARDGIDDAAFSRVDEVALTESDIATMVADDAADCGLAIAAVACRHGLGFLPLHRERFDLAVRRRAYFEPPIQRLLAFARTPAFAAQAARLGGYDVGQVGRVAYNP